MTLAQLRERYECHYTDVAGSHPKEEAAGLVVGGDFDAVGALEYFVLKAHGLSANSMVVDIGCGTGRLAVQLAQRGHEHYAGFDIVASAVNDARVRAKKRDWAFTVMDGISVPLPASCADFVCFFSVLTHTSHEHSFLFLREARRLLKVGGIVILTFLEFKIPSHWAQFESAIRTFNEGAAPIVFLDREAITAFATHLKFEVLGLVDGDIPSFPIEEAITCEDGRVMTKHGSLGQSLAILRKS